MATKKSKVEIPVFRNDDEDTVVQAPPAAPAQPAKSDNGKLYMKNTEGKMLKCEFTLARKKDAPDPLSITVNEERYYIPRGTKAIVPWYFVQHMLLNVERKFRTDYELTGTGIKKPVLKAEDQQTEAFTYKPIDPAPDNPPFV